MQKTNGGYRRFRNSDLVFYAFKRLSRHNKIEYCTRMQNSYADDNVSYFGILIYLGNADWVIMQGTTKL